MYTINYSVDDNKKLSVLNASPVISGENDVTQISVTFPSDYSTWSKYVIFKTKTQVNTTQGLLSIIPVLLVNNSYTLPNTLISAEIQNIQFKTQSDSGQVFSSTILNFPTLQPSLSSNGTTEIIPVSGMVVRMITGSGGALVTQTSDDTYNVNVTGTGGDMLQTNYANGTGGSNLNKNDHAIYSDNAADICQYDVKQHALYDINHIDVAINALVPILNSGDQILLPHGNYNFTATINLSNIPNDCKIIFDGILNQIGSFSPAIKLSGKYFEFKLNELNSNITPLTDYSNIVNDGIVIGSANCYNAKIDINRINGFLTGIKLYPLSVSGVAQGIQYNHFNFFYILNCKYPVYFTNSDLSWTTENTFTGGKVSGYYGIYVANTVANCCNNNKFYGVGFEEITSIALNIVVNSSIHLMFIGCRMMEAIGGLYINDLGATNLYIFSHFISLTNLNIASSLTRYIGPLSETQGGSWIYLGFVKPTSTTFRLDVNSSEFQRIQNANVTVLRSTRYLSIATPTAAVVLTLDASIMYEGFEMLISCYSYTNTITIKNADGSTAIAAGIITGGTYKLMYFNSAWHTVQLTTNSISPA